MNAMALKDLLVGALQTDEPQLAFFAGAGLSVPAGLPDFKSFSAHILNAIVGDDAASNEAIKLSADEISALAVAIRPEVLLQLLVKTLGHRTVDFYQCLESQQFHTNHLFLALALRKGHVVLTTNVDCLVEAACAEIGFVPKVCIDEEDFHRYLDELAADGGMPSGALFKLHGSIDLHAPSGTPDRYRSLQLSLRQVGIGLTEHKTILLESCLQAMDMVFLGYSSCDHFSVQPVLTKVKTGHSAYWYQFVNNGNRRQFPILNDRKLPYGEEFTPGFDVQSIDVTQRASTSEQSIQDVLANRSRGSAFRWYGDTNDLLAQALAENGVKSITAVTRQFDPPPVPMWTKKLSGFEQLSFAARLYQQAGNPQRALVLAKHALNSAATDGDRAQANSMMGNLLVIASTDEAYDKAKGILDEALRLYEVSGNLEGAISTRLDIVNVLRRKKKYPDALRYSRDIENLLNSPGGLSVEYAKQADASLRRLRGLTLGLSGKGPHQDRAGAIVELEKAERSAKEIGDIVGRASTLNSLGLVMQELPEPSVACLLTAEGHLQKSFELHQHVGDTRACFQPLRNLGLVRTKLATVATDAETRERNLKRAEEAFELALGFLDKLANFPANLNRNNIAARLQNPHAAGEFAEVYFRLGESAALQNHPHEAAPILSSVAEFYRRQGDWHNLARTLDLLHQNTNGHQAIRPLLDEIAAIYRDVLRLPKRLAAMAEAPIRQENAIRILAAACERAASLGDRCFADEFERLATDLLSALGKPAQ